MSFARRARIYQLQSVLSAANLYAWHTTPVELVPAPGANKIIQVVSFFAQLRPGSVFFQTDASLGSNFGAKIYLDAAAPLAGTVFDSQMDNLVTYSTARIFSWSGFSYGVGLAASGPSNRAAIDSVNKPLMIKGDGNMIGGLVATSTLGAGGLGYAVNDTGSLDPNNNGSALYKVLTVGGGGDVLTYQITDPGSGYIVQNGYDTDSSGVGTGLTINVTSVTKGNGSVVCTVQYSII